MCSISSASSNTTVLILERSSLPRRRMSSIRPGVATTTLRPRSISDICRSMLAPPYTAPILTPGRCAAIFSMSVAICRHSSRVGLSTKASTLRFVVSSRCRMGRPNAAVLPVPVCASAIRSVAPPNSNGMTCSCTGMASVKPKSDMADNNSAFKFSSSNLIKNPLATAYTRRPPYRFTIRRTRPANSSNRDMGRNIRPKISP